MYQRSRLTFELSEHHLGLLRDSGILLQLISDEGLEKPHADAPRRPGSTAQKKALLQKLLWLLRNMRRLCRERRLPFIPAELKRRMESWERTPFAVVLIPFALLVAMICLLSGGRYGDPGVEPLVFMLLMLLPASIPYWILRTYFIWLDSLALRMALDNAYFGEGVGKKDLAAASEETDATPTAD
jgi:hypothetical protein